MRLEDLLGSRIRTGADDAPAYEGPIAGDRASLDLGAACVAIERIECALQAVAPASTRVGILSNHQIETYVSVLASVTGGFTFVPLNPKFPESRLQQIIELGDVGVIVHDTSSTDLANQLPSHLPRIDASAVVTRTAVSGESARVALWRNEVGDRSRNPDETAYVMFTSGSTGTPKGVPVSFGNLLSYVEGIVSTLGLDRGLRHSQLFDLSFDLSIHDIFVSNFAWCTLVAPTSFDLMTPSRYASRERIDVWFSVPLLGAQLGRATRKPADRGLRHILFCGEALPMETVASCRAWLSESGEMWNLYGPTEATIAFTAARVTDSPRDAGNASIGLPFGRNEIGLLVDGLVTPSLAEGAEGELLLGGPQVFEGYSTDAPSPFVEAEGTRWYRSGDLVRVDAEGVYFRGRIDSQVKYRGYRIELGEIEVAVRRTFGLSTVAATLIGEQADSKLVVFYLQSEASKHSGGLDPSSLGSVLPSYMVPSEFVGLNAMPTNQNGKIDRRSLVGLIQ